MRFRECLRFSDKSSLLLGDIIIRSGGALPFLRKEVHPFPKTTPLRPGLTSLLSNHPPVYDLVFATGDCAGLSGKPPFFNDVRHACVYLP